MDKARRVMERPAIGKGFGFVGLLLLLVSFLRLFGFRFLSPAWSVAILILSALAVISFIVAGSLANRWWYSGVLFSILSALCVFAFAAG